MERILNGTFRFHDYAIDRATRIFLPLVPALILTAVVAMIAGYKITVWHFVGNFISLQGVLVPTLGKNIPLWSLAYEVWFYVLIAALGVFSNSKKRFAATVVFVFIFIIFTKLNPTYLFCWVLGIAALILAWIFYWFFEKRTYAVRRMFRPS